MSEMLGLEEMGMR